MISYFGFIFSWLALESFKKRVLTCQEASKKMSTPPGTLTRLPVSRGQQLVSNSNTATVWAPI
ncbi:hypothetical protein G9C98_008163 [Cotesia typhae]|uniref:Uncharacterized protein n=1 Tax=Cotesia typhae TaxID=2053667 RepID=A0A8J5R3C2_9HYME|nr:hypothetical protein G9C98_008163 [Cotesia typhae]